MSKRIKKNTKRINIKRENIEKKRVSGRIIE
jgi:hypothetical protein